MKKLQFTSDYQEGAHPNIIKRLTDTNFMQTDGYGLDPICDAARDRIRAACACPDAEVDFLIGGTQTNVTVIDALLASYEGVIAPDGGHISVHEAGAVELSGHKVLALPSEAGKISAAQIDQAMTAFFADATHDHMVLPGMVYLSQPTEFGTLYSLDELTAIAGVCSKHHLYLYIDGARLAYALAAPENDVTLPDLARLCDAFYIGGTKCGALFGEAVVVPDPHMIPHFFTIIKQHGALLAKGRLLGIQFDELFKDDLYCRIGENAVVRAQKIKAALLANGFELYIDSPTNQIFFIADNRQKAVLAKGAALDENGRKDEGHTLIRFCTSWATTAEDTDALCALIASV